MELIEQIRRDYEFGEGTIAGLARKYGVHRRMVSQALFRAAGAPRRRRTQSQAIDQALPWGAQDAAAVRYLLTAPHLEEPRTEILYPAEGSYSPAMTRALPTLERYDQLVSAHSEATR